MVNYFFRKGGGGSVMVTVSARIDDGLKSEAENVADEIGVSLSAAINIFIKRFVADNGFPFDVVAPSAVPSLGRLRSIVTNAVADPSAVPKLPHFTYLSPETNQLKTIIK